MKESSRILVLNWKDIKHPQTGGAEVVIHELCKRLVKDGHDVMFLTAKYEGSQTHDVIDGVNITRVSGGRVLHSFKAVAYYIKHFRDKYDIIIEQTNTAPYMVSYFTKSEKVVQFYHMLCREIWFYEMGKIIGLIGYLVLEPVALVLQALIARVKSSKIVTISESSKKDLVRFGFDSNSVHIIREGISEKPLKTLKDSLPKEKKFTILFHSSLREMKRPLEALRAFGIFVKTHPDSQLWVSGGGDQTVLIEYAEQEGFLNNISFFGRTSDEQKRELMQRSHVIVATSIKEGWGLIVTEANSQGTPAISYDVDGLRDSATFGGGVVVAANPQAMAHALGEMKTMVETDEKAYNLHREKALKTSKEITFKNCYEDFVKVIEME
jgi:glycosyltransferase involved in cell wall biosynthesis